MHSVLLLHGIFHFFLEDLSVIYSCRSLSRILILLFTCMFFLNSDKTTYSICYIYKTYSLHKYNKTSILKLFICLSLPLASISKNMYLRMIAPEKKVPLTKGILILKLQNMHIIFFCRNFVMYVLKILKSSSEKKPI